MEPTKFEAYDSVRFIGTETLYAVTKSDKRKHAYLIQRRADGADIQWVDGIYLELVSHQGAYPGS